MRESLQTRRLLLRRWRESDRIPFQAINADPRVMEFLPALLTPTQSGALFDRIQAHFGRHGFGPFAVELLENSTFIGYIGAFVPEFDAHFTPRSKSAGGSPSIPGAAASPPKARAPLSITRSAISVSKASSPSLFLPTCARAA